MGKLIDLNYVTTQAYYPHVLTTYGIQYESNGNELSCNCPFHDDKDHSFLVDVEKNVYRCRADSCDAQGNVLDFVNYMEEEPGLQKAAEVLARICRIRVKSEEHPGDSSEGKTTNRDVNLTLKKRRIARQGKLKRTSLGNPDNNVSMLCATSRQTGTLGLYLKLWTYDRDSFNFAVRSENKAPSKKQLTLVNLRNIEAITEVAPGFVEIHMLSGTIMGTVTSIEELEKVLCTI